MSCASEFAPLFHKKGFRMTSQRMAILHTLRHAGGHLSPTQIFMLSRQEAPGITGPTVYRTLEFLARNGFAQAARTANGRLVYELAGREHHHLVCRRCGATLEVPPARLGRLYHQLENSTGYRLDPHYLTLVGLCPDCQRTERS